MNSEKIALEERTKQQQRQAEEQLRSKAKKDNDQLRYDKVLLHCS